MDQETSTSSLPVYINISGLLYETRSKTLNKYPNTLLGNYTERMKYFCPYRNEYFFNRHRESFSSILFFYQSPGKLSCPDNINLKVFVDECEFFQLPESAITSMKRKEGGFLEDDIIDIFNITKKELITSRNKVWDFFEDPSSSKNACRFAYFNTSLLFICMMTNCLKTLEVHEHDAWEIVDIVINTYFMLEFILRLIISPNKKRFFKRFLVWIDLIALITFIPLIAKHYIDNTMTLLFTPFQLFRVIRIFRVTKLLPRFNVTEIILKHSLDELKLFIFSLVFLVTLGGTAIFTLEHEEEDTTFTSIPLSIYWAVQTFVTLGYGDMVPTSIWGKLFAAFLMLCFMPTLAVHTLSMSVRFCKFYAFFVIISE